MSVCQIETAWGNVIFSAPFYFFFVNVSVSFPLFPFLFLLMFFLFFQSVYSCELLSLYSSVRSYVCKSVNLSKYLLIHLSIYLSDVYNEHNRLKHCKFRATEFSFYSQIISTITDQSCIFVTGFLDLVDLTISHYFIVYVSFYFRLGKVRDISEPQCQYLVGIGPRRVRAPTYARNMRNVKLRGVGGDVWLNRLNPISIPKIVGFTLAVDYNKNLYKPMYFLKLFWSKVFVMLKRR